MGMPSNSAGNGMDFCLHGRLKQSAVVFAAPGMWVAFNSSIPAASQAIGSSAPRKCKAGEELASHCINARATKLSEWTLCKVTLQVASSLAQC